VAAGVRVELEYYGYGRDEVTTRAVDPYRLTNTQGHWYLLAWCHRSEGERLFRVDRIRALRPTDHAFDPPDTIADVSVFEPRPDDPRVTLRLAPAAAWVPASFPAEQVDTLPSGELRVTLAVSALPWLERLLVRLGDDAVVETASPGIPADIAARTAQRILGRYRSD
jgi:proteasome accessory factor C